MTGHPRGYDLSYDGGMTSPWTRWRKLIVLLAGAALAGRVLWVGGQTVHHARDIYPDTRATGANLQAARYERLRPHLGASHRVVGFVAISGVRDDEMGRYRVARYTLAPVVISHTTDTEIIVADMLDRGALAAFIEQKGMQLLLLDEATGLAIVRNPQGPAG